MPGRERDPTGRKVPTLTQREREVLALALRGCSDKEICTRLDMAYGTLRTHLTRLYARFGVTHRAALIARWHQLARSERFARRT
jgi:DNA-binding CsgD family transcriptional regulator